MTLLCYRYEFIACQSGRRPKEKGKHAGKTIEQLRSQLAKLKKSGPHAKDSKEFGRMKELQFAIRAKSGWGKVGAEEELDESAKLDECND